LTLAYGHDESSSSQNWSITCVSNQSTQDVDAVIVTVSVAVFHSFTWSLDVATESFAWIICEHEYMTKVELK